MKDIKEAVGNRKILTAQQVKKLPIGSVVWLHSFDRHGEHQMIKLTVVQAYKNKELATDRDYYGNRVIRRIDDIPGTCYTVEDKRGR